MAPLADHFPSCPPDTVDGGPATGEDPGVQPLVVPALIKSEMIRVEADKISWPAGADSRLHTQRPGSAGECRSADVAFTMEAFAKFNTYLVKVLPNIAAIEAPDENTFIIKLKERQSAALEVFDKEIFPLMPKHIYENTDIPTNPTNRAPVGLGPFTFEKWEEGRGITFKRNPHYWDQPKPYLDSVVVVFIPEVNQQMNALFRGEIDVLRPALPQIARAQEQAKSKGLFEMREVVVNAPERLSLDINVTRDVFKEPKVRQALLMAIDRQRLSNDVYMGLAFPAGNAIPEQFKTLTDPSVDYNKLYPFDAARAGKLLDEAGFPLKDGKRFTMDFSAPVAADAFYSEPSAQIIAANWRAIGIDVKLNLMEPQLWTTKVFRDRNFDVALGSWTGRSDPLLGVDRSFLCNDSRVAYVNATGYCNPELDAIAAQAASAAPEDRKKFYKTYAEIVARDLPHVNLTNSRKFFAVSTRFANIDAQMQLAYNENPNFAEFWIK